MSKAAFYKCAAEQGVEVSYEAGGVARGKMACEIIPFRIVLDAPEGKLFAGSETNCDCSIQGDVGTTKTDWKRALEELRAILKIGFMEGE